VDGEPVRAGARRLGLGLQPDAFALQPRAVALDAPADSAWLPRPSGNGRGAAPDLVQELSDVVGRTESCIGGIHALLARSRTAEPESRSREELESEENLERQLEVLQTLLDKLRAADPITGVTGSFTADIEAAREVCAVVEALIEGKEWVGGNGDLRLGE